ncbi:MAG TPA: hypothetical protein PLF22_03755 [Pseudomonadales bacterium]|nr:hypothetical protein [Pseudomonadales bacterium]
MPLHISLGNAIHHDRISAASGMVAVDGRLFVIGDNSPLLFELDPQIRVLGSSVIREYPVGDDGLIPKKTKPDFEAMTCFSWHEKNWLLIIGSGSKADVREWAFMLSVDDTSLRHERKISELYNAFYQRGKLSGEQTLNIEGLAVAHEHVYFLNRGNSAHNMIFRLPLAELISYMTGVTDVIDTLEFFAVKLPVLDGFEAGFSDADFWPETSSLVYSASVEATGDAYNDGEIRGSYIGLIALAQLQGDKVLDLGGSAQLLQQAGKTLLTKVEAVALTRSDQHGVCGVLASDNDNGSSDFFTVSVRNTPAPG